MQFESGLYTERPDDAWKMRRMAALILGQEGPICGNVESD